MQNSNMADQIPMHFDFDPDSLVDFIPNSPVVTRLTVEVPRHPDDGMQEEPSPMIVVESHADGTNNETTIKIVGEIGASNATYDAVIGLLTSLI